MGIPEKDHSSEWEYPGVEYPGTKISSATKLLVISMAIFLVLFTCWRLEIGIFEKDCNQVKIKNSKIFWQSDNYRMIRKDKDTIIVEHKDYDSLGQESWQLEQKIRIHNNEVFVEDGDRGFQFMMQKIFPEIIKTLEEK